MSFVGIDVSKKTLEVAVLGTGGELERHSFDNSSSGHEGLVLWLKHFSVQQVVMEATGSYHQRAQQRLQAAEVPLSVVNPAQVSYFVKSRFRRNKTDQADALDLAVYAKERPPTPATVSTGSASSDAWLRQSLARELAALQNDLTRLKNRLEAVRNGVSHPEVLDSLERRISALEAEQQTLTKQLEHETKQTHEQQLTLLCSIPGIGLKTACSLLAELGEVKHFSTAAKLVAFAGLTPRRCESGTSVNRQSAISRMGSTAPAPHPLHARLSSRSP